MKRIVCLGLALIVSSFGQESQAREYVISPELLRSHGDMLLAIGEDTQHLRNGQLQQDQRQTKIFESLEKLTKMMVSVCEIGAEFTARQPENLKGIEYLLRDLVDEKTRQVRETHRLILERISDGEKLSREEREYVQRLSVQTAAMSRSMTELRESIIPRMFGSVEEKLRKIDDIEIKVIVLERELQDKIDSICDRIAALENKVNGHGNELYQPVKPVGFTYGQSVLTNPMPNMEDIPAMPVTKGWRSINGTAWEPEGYATHKQLCSNPSPGPENVYFDTRELTDRGWISVRRYGDMFQDCSGRIVMVLKR